MQMLEVVIGGLAHFVQNVGIDMLRCHLEFAADVMSGKFVDVLRRSPS